MKKTIIILLTVLAVLSSLLTSCKDLFKKDETEDTDIPTIEESDTVESETIGFVPSPELSEEEKEAIRGGN